MPEPLSIFNARFLFYESTENPTEILAEKILKKIDNPITTSVYIALYTPGFYVKGNLQHISQDPTNSRKSQFISANLLRQVYKLSFQHDFIIMIFHETVNLILEVFLILFPLNLINECQRFHDYLQMLLKNKFCSMKTLETLSIKSDNLSKKNLVELKIPVSTSNLDEEINQSLDLCDSQTFTENFNKFDETTSEEILDSSYLSDSSDDLNNVFYRKVNYEYHTPVKYSDQLQISHENIETFIEKTIYKTKKSSLFYDEQPETLNSIDSIETIYQNDFNLSNSARSVDDNNHLENTYNIYYDQRDSLSSISNITEDSEYFNESSNVDLRNYLTIVNFQNENQTRKLIDSLNSIEELKSNSFQSFDASGIRSDNNVSSTDINYREMMNYPDISSPFYNYYKDEFLNNYIQSKSQNRNIFCWPDFLKNESKLTTSILVEMSFPIHMWNNNWSLIDKRDSLNENKLPKSVEWHEKVDRLHYNHTKKNFEINESGSLVIYCCRQICNENENSD